MALAFPRLFNGSTTLELPHPSDWEVPRVISGASQEALGGNLYNDVSSIRYRYVLKYDAMWNDVYEALNTHINSQYLSGLPMRFTYPKWPQSTTGVDCFVSMNGMSKRGGPENTYLVSCEVVIEEVVSRI